MSSSSTDVRSMVIIGSGPAGLTAALYAARANLKPLVIEGLEAGGQLMLTTMVDNFPGFRDGIMGPDLMAEMRAQVERFGAEILQGDVTAVDLRQEPFRVSLGAREIQAKTLVIATGASARLMGLPAELELMGHGVSTCATCDGYFFRDQDIAVVGGGDSAMEEATFLTRFASKVHLIHRRGDLRASKIMQERALANKKIHWQLNSLVDEIKDPAKGVVSSIVVRNLQTGERREIPLTGLFVAIGHQPNTSLFTGQIDMDASGYILTHEGSRTSVPGVFACGDVQDRVYRQAITAAGSGCMAAIDCERYLEAVEQGLVEAVRIED